MGAITKTAEDAELLSVVRKIAAGGQFISPEIEKMLKGNPPVPKLTPRQLEILSYMVRGLTIPLIEPYVQVSRIRLSVWDWFHRFRSPSPLGSVSH